jgi:hypothetical protein
MTGKTRKVVVFASRILKIVHILLFLEMGNQNFINTAPYIFYSALDTDPKNYVRA